MALRKIDLMHQDKEEMQNTPLEGQISMEV